MAQLTPKERCGIVVASVPLYRQLWGTFRHVHEVVFMNMPFVVGGYYSMGGGR